MDRGALYAEEHDLILRKLPDTTGKPLAAWFKELDRARIGGFLAGLDYLRDKRHVPHHEASAIVWAYLNPTVLPAEMMPEGMQFAAADHAEEYETGLDVVSSDDRSTPAAPGIRRTSRVVTRTVKRTVRGTKAAKKAAKKSSRRAAKAVRASPATSSRRPSRGTPARKGGGKGRTTASARRKSAGALRKSASSPASKRTSGRRAAAASGRSSRRR